MRATLASLLGCRTRCTDRLDAADASLPNSRKHKPCISSYTTVATGSAKRVLQSRCRPALHTLCSSAGACAPAAGRQGSGDHSESSLNSRLPVVRTALLESPGMACPVRSPPSRAPDPGVPSCISHPLGFDTTRLNIPLEYPPNASGTLILT